MSGSHLEKQGIKTEISSDTKQNDEVQEEVNQQAFSQTKSDSQSHPYPHSKPLKTWEITKDMANDVKDKIIGGAESVIEKTKDLFLGHEEINEAKTKTHGIIKDDYNKRIIE